MKVDFNNLRKQTAYALDHVTKVLNRGIMPENEFASREMPDGKMKHWEGDVLVSREDLEKHMHELRSCVWTLLCCYEEGNPDYAVCYEEVQQSGGLARFNPTDEDY